MKSIQDDRALLGIFLADYTDADALDDDDRLTERVMNHTDDGVGVYRADDTVLAAYTLTARSETSPTWLQRTVGVEAEQMQAWPDDVRERAAAHPAVTGDDD